jgi:hypothetical protein
MMTVVPVRRMAPTEGKVPLRTFQYISQVAGSVEKLHRLDGGDAGQRGMDGGNSLIYPVDRGSADFDQQRGGILAQFAHDRRQAGLVFTECRPGGRAVRRPTPAAA